MFKLFTRSLVAGSLVGAMLAPAAAQAELLYTHYFFNSDTELFSFGASPGSATDELRITFELGSGVSSGGSVSAVLAQGLNQIDFTNGLLQNMRQRSADGMIDPNDEASLWRLDLKFTEGAGIGGFLPEAFDVQNKDTPQQTDYDPAYLAALTGADIQAIRLTVQDACFDGQTFPQSCNAEDGLESGFQGRIFLEFFGERRVQLSEPASLPLMALLLAALGCVSRRCK